VKILSRLAPSAGFLGSRILTPSWQAFVGSLVGLGATKGVFVTTSSFSSQATEFVQHLSRRVILIDGQRLATLDLSSSHQTESPVRLIWT